MDKWNDEKNLVTSYGLRVMKT